MAAFWKISIHALREEGDRADFTDPENTCQISIHALREEGDVKRSHLPGAGDNFYPRPPRGGRQVLLWFVAALMEFLSTPSARRATRTVIAARTSRTDFYPRPPRGGRRDCSGQRRAAKDFYPRPPRGGRPARAAGR